MTRRAQVEQWREMGEPAKRLNPNSRIWSALFVGMLLWGVPRPVQAAILVVTSAADAGAGTLRAAITAANGTTTLDTIRFNIGGAGVQTITLLSALPTVTAPLLIDGYSQSGASRNSTGPGTNAVLRIELNGNNTVTSGLVLNSNDCIVQGLVINRFTSRAIALPVGRSGSIISGCFIGVNAAGTATSGTGNGIHVTGDHHRIGGGSNADRNIISGATSTAGLVFSGVGATYNNVRNNLIGVAADGLTVIGGLQSGIRLDGGASWNVIGESGQNYNRIAGCAQQGVVMVDATTLHNAVTGNYIWSNGGLGIDLNGDGPTVNDAGDGDVGPNGLQNYPVIEAAMSDNAGRVYVRFSFQGKINTGYRFDFYANPTPDPSGYGEGQVWIGSIGWPTGGGGSINSLHCTVGNNNPYPSGTMITCTATEDVDQHTSEFAPNVACYVGRPVVTNLSETVNGNTASLIDLVAFPGADGISLREAVLAANNTFDARTGNFIFFDLPGNGPQTISLQSPLPPITKATVFGGNTDPEFSGSPVVRIDGTNAGTGGVNGMTFNAGWGAVIGLCFTNFSGDGIVLNRSNCSVFASYFGVLPDGVSCGGNGGVGVRVNNTQSCTIGSSAGSYGPNVISGNAGGGVLITGANASGNVVANCRIGTNANGTAAICYQPFGVGLEAGAVSNVIGSFSENHPNVISGHVYDGVQMQDSRANTVIGNRIGTDRSGNNELTNARSGIYLSASHDNLIGQATGGNIISGNGTGVVLRGASLRNTIVANRVGTAANGNVALRNKDSGIVLSNGSSQNVIGGTSLAERNFIAAHTTGRGIHLNGGSNNNRVIGNHIGLNMAGADLGNLDGILIENSANNIIGGPTPEERNLISGNDNYGVWISGAGSDGNQVMGNHIGTDPAGTAAIGNGTGVLIREGRNNIIGGATPAHGNLISGNSTGVFFLFANTEANEVRNNRIGTDIGGTSALANTLGVHLNTSANNNTIANNLISGNTEEGIVINSSNNNTLQDNRIGTNAAGTAALPNRLNGIRVLSSSNATIIRNNLVSGNLLDGIALASAINTQVKGNLVGTNAAGNAAIGNGKDGVWHNAGTSGTILGGTVAADRNILSGNANSGSCHENGATNNTTLGNYIGTNINGTAAIPNLLASVYYGPGCTNNTLGGTVPGARNIISGNSQQGVWIQGSSNTVVGNYIGTDVTGLLDLGNTTDGIMVDGGSGSVIGGTTPGARNVISGNNGQGIRVLNGANTVTIIGNVIGLDATGVAKLKNDRSGVYLNGNSGHVVGGNTAAHRNVISGNGEQGVRMLDASNNVVIGNYLGTDSTGLLARGNGRDGVSVEGNSQNNTIGGGTAAQRNIIGGNDQDGVWLTMANCRNNQVKGNWVGYNAAGANLGNRWGGVVLENNARNNLVGGTVAGEGNRIGNSIEAWPGVVVQGATASGNRILGNSIERNGLGIDLRGNHGVTANDLGDGDSGANGLQNFPVLTSGSSSGGNTTILGTLNSSASSNYRIEFFSSPTGSSTGNGEGSTFLGTVNVSTDGSGNGTINAVLPGVSVPNGHVVTATATDAATNNTSEFSPWLMVGASVTGTVYEDVNYGGGAGRDRATALAQGGSGRPNARVELYDASGVFLASTLTDASGAYSFSSVPTGDVTVRVVNTTVSSARNAFSVAAHKAVQTTRFHVDATGMGGPSTDRVGGEDPRKVDAGPGTAGLPMVPATTLASLTTATTTPQSISNFNLTSAGMANVDFGFSFNVVCNTNDAGQGSLRQFIIQANGLGDDAGLAQAGLIAGRDNAVFMISNGTDAPGLRMANNYFTGGVATIQTASALPAVTFTLVLDASKQPGFVDRPIVEVRGQNVVGADGFYLGQAPNSVVRGFILNQWGRHGIHLISSSNNTVLAGNWIGLNAAGTAASANGGHGIHLTASTSCTVGGASALDRNVIAGNGGHGVNIESVTGNTRVIGNYIGSNVNGSSAIANTGSGIFLGASATTVQIGGVNAGEGNLIAGNVQGGIEVTSTASNATIRGNSIGLNAAGTAVLPNQLPGIYVAAPRCTIGGTTAAARNLIAGNLSHGIRAVGATATELLIIGNHIGTNAAGTADLGNGSSGIHLGDVVGARIGGTTADSTNLICWNDGSGVYLASVLTTNNMVRGNRIGTNAAGTVAQPNLGGIYLNSALRNSIENNLISGNNSHGIVLNGAQENNIFGNKIGTNAFGTAIIANGQHGIWVGNNCWGTVIDANLISGNAESGVNFQDLGENVQVMGNYIGTDVTGTIDLGNAMHGIHVRTDIQGITIGGANPGQPNLISGNNLHGIKIENLSFAIVYGNKIGTTANGNGDLGNTLAGIAIEGNNNYIFGNTISGNDTYGLVVDNATGGGTGTTITNNRIGTNADGTAALGNTIAGILLRGAANSTIGGNTVGVRNIISGNGGDGILLQNGATGNNIAGNHIGTNTAGTSAIPNAMNGVNITGGANNTIGGTTAAHGNLVSGNTMDGIHVRSTVSSGNSIRNNRVGTDVSGATAVPNDGGIYIEFGATNTVVRNNLISGNTGIGITLEDATVTGTQVAGNLIGTNSTGLLALGNSVGLVMDQAAGLTIGGTTAADRNVISGNSVCGIELNNNASNNSIRGNYIGVGSDGTTPRPNGVGVLLRQGANENWIGGTGAGQANLIANNTGIGVRLDSDAGVRNRILGNSIHSNGALGIDLHNNGVTANDIGDPDVGANLLQNFPVLGQVVELGSSTSFRGQLNSTPNTSFRIELFNNGATGADPTGYGEGRTFIGSFDVTTGASGNVTFDQTLPVTVAVGDRISSTATSMAGGLPQNTSEFSQVRGALSSASISGTVFEDVNYGGGAGRDRATALANGGSVRAGARVELYDGTGAFLSATTTNASGLYRFEYLQPVTDYYVRVVNSTVTSGRSGYVAGLMPVQTFRTGSIFLVYTPLTDRVGGERPGKIDAGNGTTTLAALSTATTEAQSLTLVNAQYGESANIDFGFNFNLVVNTNDAGQGSLRQFILNANALNNTGLAIQGQPAGREVALFMIADGLAHPGLNTDMASLLTGGVARIVLTSALPVITQTVTIDGSLQTTFVGNTNPGTMGSGGVVGVDALTLSTYQRPEVAIDAGGFLGISISNSVSDVTVARLAVYHATTGVSILGGASGGSGHLLHDLFLGLTAAGTDPGAGSRNTAFGASVTSPSRASVRNCFIGHNGFSGVTGFQPSSEVTIAGCETFNNGWASSGYDGIDVDGINSVVRGNLSYNNTTATGSYVAGAGSGIELGSSSGTASNNMVDNNTVRNNVGAGITVRSGMNGVTIRRNIVTANSIGVLIGREGSTATDNVISQNQIHGNTGLGIDLSNAATGPDGVTLNDNGDVDTGSNGLLNFPVIESVALSGGNMIISGFARPGSLVEFFMSDNDPSGFGEGQAYLFSGLEGSAADLDNTSGTYGPGAVNGVAQGTDNTTRFRFSFLQPVVMTSTSMLTATATLANNTSEFSGSVPLNQPPVAVCQPASVTLDASGNATITAAMVNNGSYDPDGTIASMSVSPTTVSCTNAGPVTVTLTVTDNLGASAQCTATVTVVDNTAPVISGCPADISVNALACTGAAVTWTEPTVTDNCSGATMVRTSPQGPGSTFAVGTHTVTYLATDAAGNTSTCSFTVTVPYVQLPGITCPAALIRYTDPGLCSSSNTNLGLSIATVWCPSSTVTLTNNAVFPLSVGTHTVVYTALDNHGNSRSCTQSVTIFDGEAPVISCPSNITVSNDPGVCGAVVNYVTPVGTDNCSGATTVRTVGPASGSTFPVGNTTVTHVVTDAAGLTATCSFTVTVNDTENPVAICQNITVNIGTASIAASAVNNGSTDNCAITSMSVSPNGPFNTVGTFPVVLTVTDAAGNTNTCNATVTVTDSNPPTAVCQDVTIYLNGTGTATITPGMIDGGSTDNGVISGWDVSQHTFDCSDIGANNVTLFVTDDGGNTSTCTAIVSVLDTIAPVITCPSNITVDNDAGLCGAVVTYSLPTATDNCAGFTITRTAGPASGSIFPVGGTPVTHRVTDASGNWRECSFLVTVNDSEAPTVICPGNITVNAASGTCQAVVTYDAPTVVDNCGNATLTRTAGPASGSSFPVGMTPVIYEITQGGQTNSCAFTVTVVDNIAPVIVGCPSNITVNAHPACTGIATWTPPTFTDNCTGGTLVRAGLAPGSSFPLGVSTITYTATDAAGNTAVCSFTVTVLDVTAPSITCPPSITRNADPGTCSSSNDDLGEYTAISTCGTGLNVTLDVVFPLSVGAHMLIYIATDNNGNASTCQQIVTIVDAQAPTIACPSNITVSNDPGVCGAVVNYVTPVGTDNCSGATTVRTAGPASGSTFPVGNTTVTHVVTDAAGLTATCSFTVTVNDTENPVAICQNITVNIGTASITASAVNNGSTDNCAITSMSVSPNGPFNAVGTFPVVLTVTDAAGNTSTCNATVTVTDSNPPTAVCQDVTIHLNGAGTASITPTMLDGGSTDNGHITGMDVSQYTFDCSDLGANEVTLFVTDDGGNTSTCIATVLVLDTITPTINCPASIIVNNAPGICGAPVTYTLPTATDNCAGFTITRTAGPASGATFPVGITTVTHRVTDLSGNWRECSFLVTVNDNEAPTVTCPGNITVNVASGTCQAVVNYDPPTVVDNCGNATLTRTAGPASGASFPVGVTHVIHQITHGGQTNSCAFSVTVVDHIAPVIVDCPGNLEVTAGGACTATATWTAPTFTDNCTGGTIVRTGPAPGSTFPIGNTTITYTATDAAGNTATCSFIVTVVDNTAPQIIGCPSDIVVSAGPACTATASWTAPTFTENCAGGTLVRTGPTSGSAFPIGTTTITYTATDAAGNSTECSFLVTVFDQTAPTISCPANIVVGNDPGVCDAVVNYATPVGTDNCSGSTTALTDGFASGSIFPVGTTTVTHTVTDAAGLTASCSFTVTVNDTEAPVAICQNVIADIGGLGSVTITADQVNNGSTDNCGITAMSVTPSTFTAVGTYTVTLTVTDAAGNTDDCTATVTITDNNPPTALCNDTTLYLGSAGTASIQAVDLDGGSTDNGSIASITASLTAFNCGHVGANNVTLTVTDDGGNSATCISVVTVLDTIHPVITCQPDQAHTNNSGQCGATVTYMVPTATDNCTVTITRTNGPASGSFFPIGTTEVTHDGIDPSGNRVSCTFLITVVDNTLPVLNCLDDITLVNDPGLCGAVVNYVTPVGTDNCPDVTTTLMEGLASGSFFPVGTTTVSHEAADASGNRVVCFFTVTVIDAEAPVALCQNVIADIGSAGSVTITAAQVNNGSTDNCAIIGMTVVPSTFTTVGTHTVTLTVTDAAGNTDECTATVTITDNSPPVALCNDTTLYLNSTGQATINAADLDGGSTDNGTIAFFTADQTTFDCSDLGANNVTLTVTDDGGNTATCVAVVTVLDTIAPTVVCQDITAYLDEDGQVNITGPELDGGTADNCGTAALSFQLSNATFDCDDLGTHAVTLTVTDASGNSSQCVAHVTVADNMAPALSCQAATVVTASNGWAVINASAVASWTDNCGAVQEAWTSVDSLNVLGDTIIWVYVEDMSGNVDSCAAILTVTDGTAPVAICQDVTVYLNTNGQATVTAADIDGGSMDNGTISSLTASQTTFGCDHLGANNVTLTVTDDDGNSASCVAVVTVLDTIAPTVACQSIAITLDADGQATITGAMLDDGSTDNCDNGGLTYTASTTTFSSPGTYTVTLTVTDASGNSSSCAATVQVLPGATLPVALCQPVTIALDANGQATITASDIDGGSHAEAGIASLIASQTVFGCADLGVQQVTLTVGDILGAIASCVAEVTVIDTLAPILVCQDITITLDAYGQATVVAAALAGSVIDNCGAGELTYSTDVTTLTSLGEHAVVLTVTDASGNSSTCTATVTVVKGDAPLVIPHGFSPNGDGIADTWVIQGLEKYPHNNVLIFNRWGQEVYEAAPYNNDWTGHAGKQAVFGEELPAAVYFYQLDLGDGEKPRTGYIQLNR